MIILNDTESKSKMKTKRMLAVFSDFVSDRCNLQELFGDVMVADDLKQDYPNHCHRPYKVQSVIKH